MRTGPKSTPYKIGERSLKTLQTKQNLADLLSELKLLHEELASAKASLQAVRVEVREERRLRLHIEGSCVELKA
eukprot:117893-Prorocentrum_lima.AAC.1